MENVGGMEKGSPLLIDQADGKVRRSALAVLA